MLPPSLNAGKLPPTDVPLSRRLLLPVPTPTTPTAPQDERLRSSREMSMRSACLYSGQCPTAPQLRRLLRFLDVLDSVVPVDRAAYENPVFEVHVDLQPERPPKDMFEEIIVMRCDSAYPANGGGVDREDGPHSFWVPWEDIEEQCIPHDALTATELKDVPVTAPGSLLGYDTRLLRKSTTSAMRTQSAEGSSSEKPSRNSGKCGTTMFGKLEKSIQALRLGCVSRLPIRRRGPWVSSARNSGQGPSTAPQLRRLLGFPGVVDHVVPGDRCEVTVNRNPRSPGCM